MHLRPRTCPTAWLPMLTLLLCALLSLAQLLTEPDINDEHMYLAAARLADDHVLYRDFAFLQTPYMVYLYRCWSGLLPNAGLLMSARLLQLLLAVLTWSLLCRVCFRLSRSGWLTAALLWLLFSSAILRSDLHFARNYQLPLLLTLCAVALLERTVSRAVPGRLALFAAGFCLGLAVGVKLTFALPALAFGLAVLVLGGTARLRLIRIAALALGGVLAMLPMLALFWRAGWERVRFGLWEYHRLNTVWRQAGNFDHGMDAAGKARMGLGQLLEITNLSVLLLVAALALLLVSARRALPARERAKIVMLSIMAAAALLLYLLPTPAWIWYLGPLWLLLTLLAAELFGGLADPAGRRRIGVLTVVLVCFSLLVNFSRDAQSLGMALDNGQRTVRRLRQDSLALARLLRHRGLTGPVATLRPLIALEAGLPVYDELASADFAYRVGDLIAARRRQNLRISSAGAIYDLLEGRPPAAIVCGFDSKLEEPLLRFARDHAYRPDRLLAGGGRVYLKPPDSELGRP